jgi:hypothetical protein
MGPHCKVDVQEAVCGTTNEGRKQVDGVQDRVLWKILATKKEKVAEA